MVLRTSLVARGARFTRTSQTARAGAARRETSREERIGCDRAIYKGSISVRAVLEYSCSECFVLLVSLLSLSLSLSRPQTTESTTTTNKKTRRSFLSLFLFHGSCFGDSRAHFFSGFSLRKTALKRVHRMRCRKCVKHPHEYDVDKKKMLEIKIDKIIMC